MIKDKNTHNNVYFTQMKIHQNFFPLHFNVTNIKEIMKSDFYFATLLIIGSPHRLLWESILSRQYLSANNQNHVHFIVKDFC